MRQLTFSRGELGELCSAPLPTSKMEPSMARGHGAGGGDGTPRSLPWGGPWAGPTTSLQWRGLFG